MSARISIRKRTHKRSSPFHGLSVSKAGSARHALPTLNGIESESESGRVPEGSVEPLSTLGETSFESLPSLAGIFVLLVDDEADVRDLLTFVLEECGALVVAVRSTAEALAAIDQHPPDVLVSDIMMPGDDGYTLMRRIKQLEADRGIRIPAAAVTAYASPEDREEAFAAGFTVHVAKPILIYDLTRMIAALAGR